MKNKILLIHHGVGYGGGLIALLGLINELQEKNDVIVYCIFEGEALEYIKQTGVKVITPRCRIYYKYFYKILVHSSASYNLPIIWVYKIYAYLMYTINKFVFSRIELKGLLKHIDLVYLNSTFISDWSYYPSKCLKKVIIHVREPLKNNRKSIYYKLIRNNIKNNCNWVIAITNDNAERVNLICKTGIVYDPIVLHRSKNSIVEKYYPIDDNYKYFMYLGGSNRIKGYEQMVESLKFLENDIKVFFLGSYVNKINQPLQLLKAILNPYKFKEIKLFNKINNSEKAILIGKTHDVFYYYSKSMANISPFSKPHASLPILESFSVGLPVIVSDIKGMDEFVIDNVNGKIFKNNCPKSLAEKINDMSKLNEQQIIQYKRNSNDTYAKIYSNIKSVNEIVNQVLKKN